jgi:pyruvate kinase
MLAGETAVGAHPVRAVETLDAVIRDAEQAPTGERIVPDLHPAGSLHGRAVCEAAVALAAAAQAEAIVAVTRAGHTARLLSSLRPSTHVFAATASTDVAGACAMLWGVTPVPTAVSGLEELARILVEQGRVRSGAIGVFVNVSAELDVTDANYVNLQRFK